jgi:parallel beta-helix repeat protein
MMATRSISPAETLSNAPIPKENVSNNLSESPVIEKRRISVCKDGCDYTSIQSAVDFANPGDVIVVQNGTYHERVNITKSIVLRGEGDGDGLPVIDAEFNGSAMTFSADGITLENINVTNSFWRTFRDWSGIRVISNNNTILNVIAHKNEVGILLIDSSNNTITGNKASENYGNGLSLMNSENNRIIENSATLSKYIDGISLVNSRNNTIAGNKVIENYGNGITLKNSSNNTILENAATLNGKDGLSLINSQNNTLRGNNATFNKNLGLDIELSTWNIIEDNLMEDNLYNFDASDSNFINSTNSVNGKKIYYLMDARDIEINSSSNAGTIYCIGCDNVTIRDLLINNNKNAIYLYKTNNTRIENNTFSNNSNGIYINFSNNIDIMHSNLTSNQFGLVISESTSINIIDNNFSLNQGGLQIKSSINNNICKNNFTSRDNAYDLIIPKNFDENNTICPNQTNDLKIKFTEELNHRTVSEGPGTYPVSADGSDKPYVGGGGRDSSHDEQLQPKPTITKQPDDADLKELFGGIISFKPKIPMVVNETTDVVASIAPNNTQANMTLYRMKETDADLVIKGLTISKWMRLTLKDPEEEFNIKAISTETQKILGDVPATWRWTVKPKEEGIHRLILVATLLKEKENGEKEPIRDVDVQTEEIEVIANENESIKKSTTEVVRETGSDIYSLIQGGIALLASILGLLLAYKKLKKGDGD